MSYRCAKPEAAICASAANAPFVRIADVAPRPPGSTSGLSSARNRFYDPELGAGGSRAGVVLRIGPKSVKAMLHLDQMHPRRTQGRIGVTHVRISLTHPLLAVQHPHMRLDQVQGQAVPVRRINGTTHGCLNRCRAALFQGVLQLQDMANVNRNCIPAPALCFEGFSGKKWKCNFLHPPPSPFFAWRAVPASRNRAATQRSIHFTFPAMFTLRTGRLAGSQAV